LPRSLSESCIQISDTAPTPRGTSGATEVIDCERSAGGACSRQARFAFAANRESVPDHVCRSSRCVLHHRRPTSANIGPPSAAPDRNPPSRSASGPTDVCAKPFMLAASALSSMRNSVIPKSVRPERRHVRGRIHPPGAARPPTGSGRTAHPSSRPGPGEVDSCPVESLNPWKTGCLRGFAD
jgi:hypothetical protein